MNKKITLMMLLLMTATIGAYAQGNGIAGINEATKMVTSYFRSRHETHLCRGGGSGVDWRH